MKGKVHILNYTLYFCPWARLATKCVILPLKSRLTLPPMKWTKSANWLTILPREAKPVKQTATPNIDPLKSGRDVSGRALFRLCK